MILAPTEGATCKECGELDHAGYDDLSACLQGRPLSLDRRRELRERRRVAEKRQFAVAANKPVEATAQEALFT